MDNSKESHLERTADEPRGHSRHTVVVARIHLVGQTIRVLRLEIPPDAPDIVFRPGQWVDTFCPGVAKAGGFTLTSAPSLATTRTHSRDDSASARYLELAVRQSPDNPAAEWLWQPEADIVGCALQVRVGGSFVYPPELPASASRTVSGSVSHPPERVVFVAGGVGINPLMSMLSYMGEHEPPASETTVEVLYSVREEVAGDDVGENDCPLATRILFLDRLAALFAQKRLRGTLRLFLTDSKPGSASATLSCDGLHIPCEYRRMETADLDAAVLGGSAAGRDGNIHKTYVYVCGVPAMTDAFVAHLTAPATSGGLDMSSQNVFFEKWW